MAQNRKHQAVSGRFGPAVIAFLLCLLIGGSGVGYVWQKSQISDLGRELKKRELRLADVKFNNERLRRQLDTLRSPRFLDQRVRELNLGLGPAQPAQILRLREPESPLAGESPSAPLAAQPLERGSR